MMVRIPHLAIAIAALLGLACAERAEIPGESKPGISVEVDETTGRYEVRAAAQGWTFAGEIGGPLAEVAEETGKDGVGTYRQIRFGWNAGTAYSGSIRVYDEHPAVLFGVTCDEACAKPHEFPRFTALPDGLHPLSFRDKTFAPMTYQLEKNGTPWVFFDDQANTAIISPAANFMLAEMRGDGKTEVTSGLRATVAGLPAGFAHHSALVFGAGINVAWDTWGQLMTARAGKQRPANDADIGLRYLGYWTDNGAQYYYNYDQKLGYAGTLLALLEHHREMGIPFRYLQLDSWWYWKTLTSPTGTTGSPKNPALPLGEWNRYGGLLEYKAHPAVFPDGLAAFQKQAGLPLITHNRWIDPKSPYHEQYEISGLAAVDPRFWDDIMAYVADAGAVTYEQDWLNDMYQQSPALGSKPGVGDAFLDNMARAAKDRGMTMQYCMASPRMYLQGVRYDNLTTTRNSLDRFQRKFWDPFLFTSRLSSALGIWPWTDVFRSNELDNLLIATLSAGMVGVGDQMGKESKENLLRSARADGMLVKPDVPLVPADQVYLADAAGRHGPMVAWTYTEHGKLRTAYVFSYARNTSSLYANSDKAAVAASEPKRHGPETSFTPAAFGFSGSVQVYDTRARTAQLVPAGQPFNFALEEYGSAFHMVVPVGRSGIALVGDEGKFVSMGKKRIADLEDAKGKLTVTVIFAAGEESLRLTGYARNAPRARARTGKVGELVHDRKSGRFELQVRPGPEIGKEAAGGDPIRRAVLTLISR
jgi:hypothetical protein